MNRVLLIVTLVEEKVGNRDKKSARKVNNTFN